MARIINIEKSQYLNDNIEIYTSNKVGQYSKFLEKNPLFVTYFHINENQTRTDVGTGGVNSDLGKNSPVRFNQINNFPVYNIPELKPDADFGENGYDIELDISDGTILPNTIKPGPGDHILIVLPDTIEFLFRVNAFSYNTIQSNDFYNFSADLKHTGHNLIDKIKGQVVEEYETIFENIGTNDKCFIQTKDVKKIQNIGKLFLEMRDAYYSTFFDTDTGTFVCKNNTDTSYFNDAWFYDKYINKFIMDSELYYTENNEKSVILSCCDIKPDEMRTWYMQTLQYAVLNHTTDYLGDYPYYYQVDIKSVLSPFIINHLNCKGVNLVITRKELVDGHSDGLDSGMLHEYYSHDLIKKVKYPESEEDDTEEVPNINEDDQSNDSNTSGKFDYYPYTVSMPNNEYVESEQTTEDIPEEENGDMISGDTTNETYLDTIIYQWLTNQTLEIDRKSLIPYMLRVDNYTYLMMPLVMYVIMKYYGSYFEKTEL